MIALMSTSFRKTKPEQRPDVAEPALADLLDDPVLHVLMDRDHVDRALLDRLIRETRERLGSAAPLAVLPPPVPDILFQDCRG